MKAITPKRFFERAPHKPRVNPNKRSPLLKLKHLPAEEREKLYQLTDAMTCAQWREHVRKKYDVTLKSDGNVTAFRDWHWNTERLEKRNAKIEAFDDQIRKLMADGTSEEYRAAVLAYTMQVCAAEDDWKGAVAAARAGAEADRASTQRKQFEFDAAKACLAHLPKLREIVRDATLSESAKIDAARLALFGSLPE